MPNDPILFEAFAFAPEDGLKNHEYSPTEPESEDAIRAQIQGISDQLRDHVNTLKTQLNATESACSGRTASVRRKSRVSGDETSRSSLRRSRR